MRQQRWFRLVIFVAVAAAAVAAFQYFAYSGDDTEPFDKSKGALAVANTFPAPSGATQAFPDSTVDGVASKGWRATGTIAEACAAWREAYRGWIDPGQAGTITGEEEQGRRCSLSGPKAGFTAQLSLTVYGDDPTPSGVLTVKPLSQ
jgi:hypothetical protein